MLETTKIGDLRKLSSTKLTVNLTERVSRDVEVTLSMADVIALADGMPDGAVLSRLPGLADLVNNAVSSSDATASDPKHTLSVWSIAPTS